MVETHPLFGFFVLFFCFCFLFGRGTGGSPKTATYLVDSLSLVQHDSPTHTARPSTSYKMETIGGPGPLVVFDLVASLENQPKLGVPPLKKRERAQVAMGQNPNRTPSEHPNPTTQIGPKMGGEFTYQPKWDSV